MMRRNTGFNSQYELGSLKDSEALVSQTDQSLPQRKKKKRNDVKKKTSFVIYLKIEALGLVR